MGSRQSAGYRDFEYCLHDKDSVYCLQDYKKKPVVVVGTACRATILSNDCRVL